MGFEEKADSVIVGKIAGKFAKHFLYFVIAISVLSCMTYAATPEGPSITVTGNSTRGVTNSTLLNVTGGVAQNTSGGYIFTTNMVALQRDTRWKAYYGNITGTLTLDDANGYTIYNWPVTVSQTGNIYSTRASTTVNWGSIACASRAQIEAENLALNQTSNPNDNISATFNSTNHTSFTIAGTTLNSCFSTSTFVNDNAQTQTSSDKFQEIVADDGTNIVYATKIENDQNNYMNAPADFQMIVPENGQVNWDSSTAYYFYVELT